MTSWRPGSSVSRTVPEPCGLAPSAAVCASVRATAPPPASRATKLGPTAVPHGGSPPPTTVAIVTDASELETRCVYVPAGAEQPAASTAVTVYVVVAAGATVIVRVVAPVDQRYD